VRVYSSEEIICNECELTSCVPAEERCDGIVREICNQDGNQWENVACAAGEKCVPNGPDRTICDASCPEENAANCDGDLSDGCEALNTLDNCGGCDQPCQISSGTGTCETGTCQVASCDAGAQDLNNDPIDGCEAVCTPDATRCASNDFEICSADGQWEARQECGEDDPDRYVVLIASCWENHSLGTGCFECEPGEEMCSPDMQENTIRYTCDNTGNWERSNCGFGAIEEIRCYDDDDTHPFGSGCFECFPNYIECGSDGDLYSCNASTGLFEFHIDCGDSGCGPGEDISIDECR